MPIVSRFKGCFFANNVPADNLFSGCFMGLNPFNSGCCPSLATAVHISVKPSDFSSNYAPHY